jgi:hypothetical protein
MFQGALDGEGRKSFCLAIKVCRPHGLGMVAVNWRAFLMFCRPL